MLSTNRENSLLVSMFRMKVYVKILTIVFFLALFSGTNGQDIPWTYRITGSNHTLFLSPDLAIDVQDYSGSGVLGVFYDSVGIDICAGYVDLNSDQEYLIVYGENKDMDGVQSGDLLKYKLWDREKDCIYDNVGVEYEITSKAPNTGVFVNDGMSNIQSITASPFVVEYPTELICPNDIDISPIMADSSIYRFRFSANDGLNIDASTGRIDGTKSRPGEYKIEIKSEYCVIAPKQTFRVSSFADVDIPLQQYKCPDEFVDFTSLTNGAVDYWTIVDSLDSVETVEAGSYKVIFQNPDGCSTEQNVEVINYPEPEVQFETEYNCESTTIRLANDQLSALQWSNNDTGNSTEIHEDSNIELSYTDANQCNRVRAIDVTVKKLKIQTMQTRVVPADCYLKGRIEINNATVDKTIGDLRYEFVNQLTNEVFQSPDQLNEGKYQIQVFDDRNCNDTWQQELIVIKDCLKDRPVFSPNNDYVDDSYYIPDAGKAEVYNRNGRKVGEFETPIYWDGTNLQGQKLPMGTYLIVINEKKVINITILR